MVHWPPDVCSLSPIAGFNQFAIPPSFAAAKHPEASCDRADHCLYDP
jgi:hypothetical protein